MPKKRYETVQQMVSDIADDRSFAEEVSKRIARRHIVKQLFALRSIKGMSQQDIADKQGCTQSKISKLEHGTDDDLRLGDVRDYLASLGMEATLVVGDRGKGTVNQVKYHAASIRRLLFYLADLAHCDETVARGVASFLGESLFNLVRALQDSAKRLPTADDGTPYIDIEIQGASGMDDESAEEPETRRHHHELIEAAP